MSDTEKQFQNELSQLASKMDNEVVSEKSYPNARDCKHGQLRRSCPHCEYDRDMAEANETIQQLQTKLTEFEQQLKTAKQKAFIAGFRYAGTGDHIDEEIKAEEYANNLEGE